MGDTIHIGMNTQLKSLLLANVGNRDLLVTGQEIRSARAKGKEILDNFATHRDDLSLPILRPLISFIDRQTTDVPLDLLLYCTNQKDAEERHKANDTLYFGECIKKLLSGQKPVGKVNVREIHANPNLPDSMFRYFTEQLSWLQDRSGDYEKIFIALSGGIPACNMALCLLAVRFFEERCVPLYSIEGNDEPIPLRIGDQLLESSKREVIRRQLANYEYSVAAVLLDSLGLKLYADLARMALYRLNFDFQRAKVLATALIGKDVGEVRDHALRVEVELKKLVGKDLSSLILELHHNATVKFCKGEYLDFLGRLFRFQEAVLRYLAEISELALHTDIDKDGRHFITFQATVRKHPTLVEYLEQQIYGTEKLDWGNPYIPCLMVILSYLAEKGDVEKRSQRLELLNRLREIEELMQLRHKSPLGHGFDGVSLEAIRDRVAGFSPERLGEIIRAAGLSGDKNNPFDRVNILIAKALG